MALPEQLNYTQHIDALGIKKDRIGLAPNNGSTFAFGTSAPQFEVPCQQMSRFADFSNAYMSFNITNNDTSGGVYLEGNLGTMAFPQKLTVETTSNRKFSELDNQNCLMDIKLSQSVGKDWYDTNGKLMYGCSSNFFNGGQQIAFNGGTSHLIMPIKLSGLTENQYVPLLGRENIRFKVDLDDVSTVVYSAGDITNAEFTLSNVMLHYDVIQLSDEQMKGLLNVTGGKFIISGSDYYHQNAQIGSGDEAANISIGCSRRKAKKLIMCCRTLSQITNMALNSFSRNKANITKITVRHNGQKIGSTDLDVDATSAPETYAELLKSSHKSIMSLDPTSLATTVTDLFNIDDPDSNANDAVGRYFAEVDFTAGTETENAIGGLNIMTGNLNLELVKGATTADQYLDIFIEYHSEYVLDMNAGATWQIYN